MSNLLQKIEQVNTLTDIIAYCTMSIDKLTTLRAPAPRIISLMRVRQAKEHQLDSLENEIYREVFPSY
jgi:hypothetical protein